MTETPEDNETVEQQLEKLKAWAREVQWHMYEASEARGTMSNQIYLQAAQHHFDAAFYDASQADGTAFTKLSECIMQECPVMLYFQEAHYD